MFSGFLQQYIFEEEKMILHLLQSEALNDSKY